MASQAQVGAHGGRGAGAHARAPSAVSHGSKEPERRENYDDGNGSDEQSDDGYDGAAPGAASKSWSTGSWTRYSRRSRIRRRRRQQRWLRAWPGAFTRRGGCGRRGTSTGALSVLAEVDTARAATNQARWAFAEWNQLVKRRFGDRGALVYSQGTGKAAALVPHGDGTLEVVAVLGMRWRPGKVVSARSLRGLAAPERRCVMVTANVDIPRAEGASSARRRGGGRRNKAAR